MAEADFVRALIKESLDDLHDAEVAVERLEHPLPPLTGATAHFPEPQNPGECHLYLAEGCHLCIAATDECRRIGLC